MGGFPASRRDQGGSEGSWVPQLSLGTLRPGAPTCHPPGPGRWGLRGGGSEKFRTVAHSRHRTYPEAERDASSLRLQGLGGAGAPPPLSSGHDCARSRVCGAPARGAPPAAQLCTKAAWPCLAGGLAGRGRAARSGDTGARPSPSPLGGAPTALPGGPRAQRSSRRRALRRGGRRSHCDVSSLRGYLYPHDWISFMKPGPGVSGVGALAAKAPRLCAHPDPARRRVARDQGAQSAGTPAPLPSRRAGRGGAGARFPSATSHPSPCNCGPFVPGSGRSKLSH